MSNEEREAIAMGYAGRDFRKRRRVQVQPLLEYSSAEWSLDELIALLQKIKLEMPEDATCARVEFEGGGYDESGKFTVSYDTWESEEDLSDRIQQALRYADSAISSELEQWRRLKAKYG